VAVGARSIIVNRAEAAFYGFDLQKLIEARREIIQLILGEVWQWIAQASAGPRRRSDVSMVLPDNGSFLLVRDIFGDHGTETDHGQQGNDVVESG
jgi:hypothetical protein